MRYLTQMAADIRFWHPTAHPTEIEQAFARSADRAAAVGTQRPRGDRGLRKETSCQFIISKPKETDFEELIENCLSVVNQNADAVRDLIRTGGKMSFILQVFGDTWLQINIGHDCMAAIVRAGAGVAIENHGAEAEI